MRLNGHTAIVGDTVVLVPYRHVIRSGISLSFVSLTRLLQSRACRGTAVSIIFTGSLTLRRVPIAPPSRLWKPNMAMA